MNMNFPSGVTSHLQCDILSITNVPLSSTGDCLLFGFLIQRSVSTNVEDSDLGIEKPSSESRMLAILGNDKHILKKNVFSLYGYLSVDYLNSKILSNSINYSQ